MTSTEHVNLERYMTTFRQDPDITEEHKDEAISFVNTVAAEGISDGQQRKYLYCFKTILKKFAPDGFRLSDASERDLRTIMAEVHRRP